MDDGPRDATRVSRLRIPNLADIDFARLRRERLARLQEAMQAHEIPVGLFFNQANIRYTTGTDVMGVWSAIAMPRCCIVPAEGAPVLFEYPKSVDRSRLLLDDVRPMTRLGPGQWAQEVVGVLEELGVEHEVAVDQLHTARILALRDSGVTIVDSEPATAEAREIKTSQEIEIFKLNGAIADTMLHEFEYAIHPGVSRVRAAGSAQRHASALPRGVPVHEARVLWTQHQPMDVGGSRRKL